MQSASSSVYGLQIEPPQSVTRKPVGSGPSTKPQDYPGIIDETALPNSVAGESRSHLRNNSRCSFPNHQDANETNSFSSHELIGELSPARAHSNVRSHARRRSNAHQLSGSHRRRLPDIGLPNDLHGLPVHEYENGLHAAGSNQSGLCRRNAIKRPNILVYLRHLWRRLFRRRRGRQDYFSKHYLKREPSLLISRQQSRNKVRMAYQEAGIFRRVPRVVEFSPARRRATFWRLRNQNCAPFQANRMITSPDPGRFVSTMAQASAQVLPPPNSSEDKGGSNTFTKLSLPTKALNTRPQTEKPNYDKPLPEPVSLFEDEAPISTKRRRSNLAQSTGKLPEKASDAPPAQEIQSPIIPRNSISFDKTGDSSIDRVSVRDSVVLPRQASHSGSMAGILSPILVDPILEDSQIQVHDAMGFVEAWGAYLKRSIAYRAVIRKKIRSMEIIEDEKWSSSDSSSSEENEGDDRTFSISNSSGNESEEDGSMISDTVKAYYCDNRSMISDTSAASQLEMMPQRYSHLFSPTTLNSPHSSPTQPHSGVCGSVDVDEPDSKATADEFDRHLAMKQGPSTRADQG